MVTLEAEGLEHVFHVDEANKLLQQQMNLPTIPSNVILDMAGQGCVLVQVSERKTWIFFCYITICYCPLTYLYLCLCILFSIDKAKSVLTYTFTHTFTLLYMCMHKHIKLLHFTYFQS